MVLDREFPPDIRVENEIDVLQNAGHEVHLACYTLKGRASKAQIGKLQVYRRSISKFTYKSSVGALKFPFYFNFWKRFLREICELKSFDAIHIHDLPLAKVGYSIARKYKMNFVLDLHENWPALLETSSHANTFLGKLLSSNSQWERYEKEFTSKADGVITVVEEMKERICKLGTDESKVFVLSNHYNLNNTFELHSTTTPEKTILFYAGGLTFHRGLQVVIEGLKEILSNKKEVYLWIVGSGSYLPQLKQLVFDLEIDEHITFYGQKPFKETMELLSNSDIALIPHLKSVQTDHSSPNKLYQYMYFAKPLIVSNCNSLERLVSESNSGLMYEHDDPESFANAALELINAPNIESYGKNGRKAVIEKYNWDAGSKELLSMYQIFSQHG